MIGIKEKFVKEFPPDINICLLGLQGSRMLGLAQKEDADYDYRGIYVAKNDEILSLTNKPKETIEGGTSEDGEMDFVFHEVEKFFRLAVKGNPSVLHMFFIPKYNVANNIGRKIIANKGLFLIESCIRASFGGYALSQILYLKRNQGNTKRKEKHIRHCFRLFDCGKELIETGNMTFPLKNPQYYLDLGKKINEPNGMNELLELFKEKDKEFQSCKSVLDKKPNLYLINKLLLEIRKA